MVSTYSKVIDDLTRVIIAAELSTEAPFRGMSRSHLRLLERADCIMHDDGFRNKTRTREAQVVARAVWHDHLRPQLIDMLNSVCATPDSAQRALDRHFPDREIEYRG